MKALKAAGWTISQIAKGFLGYHPPTVSAWLKAREAPPKRSCRSRS